MQRDRNQTALAHAHCNGRGRLLDAADATLEDIARTLGDLNSARHGYLLAIDVLCSGKTGTLTRNELAVMSIHAMAGFDEPHVLALAAFASSDGGQDPVDAAIRAAALRQPAADGAALVSFLPFDPTVKRAEATIRQADGTVARVVKGAFAAVRSLAQCPADSSDIVDALQAKGFRVLAVAVGPAAALRFAGLIALSDPPREDSARLVAELRALGIKTVMVTGDFLAMSSSTDNVRPSETPSVWRIGRLTSAGVLMGVVDLAFCVGCLATGRFVLGLDPSTLRTLTVVTLVFSGQAVFYVSRERRHIWSSRPGRWLLLSSAVDLTFISVLAANGILMTALPLAILAGLLLAATVFAFILDGVKLVVFRILRVA